LGSAITQHFQAFGLRNNIGGTKIHPFAQGHFSTANIIIVTYQRWYVIVKYLLVINIPTGRNIYLW
jgi:hypothetical protein